MIKTEKITIGGKPFVRTYSDAGRYIERDGVEYEEATDPAGLGRTYTEGRIVEASEMSETEEKAMAYDILTGVIK